MYKHLRDHLKVKDLAIINRSARPGSDFPEVRMLAWTDLATAVNEADIIITATAAAQPIIFPSHFTQPKPRLLIDLSIPNNMDAALSQCSFITLKNTDTISPLVNEALHKRKQEVPKAQAIINHLLDELINWIHERKQMAMLKDIKSRLIALEQLKLNDETKVCPHQQAQKQINQLAVQFRKQDHIGCSIISAYRQCLHEPNANKTGDKFEENAPSK